MSELIKVVETIAEGVEGMRKDADRRLSALQDRIEEIESKADRPRLVTSDGTGETAEDREHRKTFLDWLRRPQDHMTKGRLAECEHELFRKRPELKDVTVGTNSAGGFAVPEQISTQIERRVTQLNPFRSIVNVQQCSTGDFKQLVDMGDSTVGWVGETGSRTATSTPTLRERAPTFGELYAYPQCSEWAVDDIFFDAQRWLIDSVGEQMASAETTAILSGNGTNRPTGILNTTPTTAADDSSPLRAAGTIQYVGLTNASSPQAINMDSLIALVGTLQSRYLADPAGVGFVMHRLTASAIRRLRSTDGQYLWEPSTQAGQPDRLLGYPVYTVDAMPTLASDAFAVLFGNFRRGYLLADRVGMRITLDQVTNPGYYRYYVRKRVGGCVLNNDAVKALRIAD